MGATLYYCTTDYTVDPMQALLRVQQTVLEAYDLVAELETAIATQREAAASTATEDKYNLRDYHVAELAGLEELAAQPLPSDLHGRIELLRRLYAASGTEIGNILDVNGISTDSEWNAVKPLLTADELRNKFGADKLLMRNASQYAAQANVWLRRGECVVVPLFRTTTDTMPAEWCFIGNTAD